MAEENGAGNLTHLPCSPDKLKITVRNPRFRDVRELVGILARSDASELMDALDREFNEAAFVLLLKGALANTAIQDQLMLVLAGLWDYEVPDADIKNPPETWDYDPAPELVEKGQAISRETMWRSNSAKNRRRMVKREILDDTEDLDIAREYVEAIKRLPYVADFLASREKSDEDESGESETPSSAGDTETANSTT